MRGLEDAVKVTAAAVSGTLGLIAVASSDTFVRVYDYIHLTLLHVFSAPSLDIASEKEGFEVHPVSITCLRFLPGLHGGLWFAVLSSLI